MKIPLFQGAFTAYDPSFDGIFLGHSPKTPFLVPNVSPTFRKAANGGAKRIVRFWGGRGGKRTIECALQNQFWRPQKVGLAWSVPVSSKETTGRRQTGGGKRIIRRGSKNRFWEGVLWYVFPSPEFSTPFCFSLNVSYHSNQKFYRPTGDFLGMQVSLPLPTSNPSVLGINHFAKCTDKGLRVSTESGDLLAKSPVRMTV